MILKGEKLVLFSLQGKYKPMTMLKFQFCKKKKSVRKKKSLLGFLEYLLDRKTESDKAGKEHKYEVIAELVHSPFSKEVFDKPYHLRLREYEREGPFFVKAEAAVAFEGAD